MKLMVTAEQFLSSQKKFRDKARASIKQSAPVIENWLNDYEKATGRTFKIEGKNFVSTRKEEYHCQLRLSERPFTIHCDDGVKIRKMPDDNEIFICRGGPAYRKGEYNVPYKDLSDRRIEEVCTGDNGSKMYRGWTSDENVFERINDLEDVVKGGKSIRDMERALERTSFDDLSDDRGLALEITQFLLHKISTTISRKTSNYGGNVRLTGLAHR